jgi:hypothetical protein
MEDGVGPLTAAVAAAVAAADGEALPRTTRMVRGRQGKLPLQPVPGAGGEGNSGRPRGPRYETAITGNQHRKSVNTVVILECKKVVQIQNASNRGSDV